MSSKNVFVIMPFSSTASCTESQWTEVFENVFCPAFEAVGYSCERAVMKTGSLISSIVESLYRSYLVLADITDRNPNVFYELGVRHSLSKRTIIVSQRASDIPSDLRGYWALKYGTNPKAVDNFKKDIERLISEIEKNPDKSDNPVSDYLDRENVSLEWFTQKQNLKKLGSLYTELTGNILALKDLREERDLDIIFTNLRTDCIKLLLQTLYVDPGPQFLKNAYELLNELDRVRYKPYDSGRVLQALDSCEQLSKEIVALRNRLSRGYFEEPQEPSLMKWERLIKSIGKSFCSIDIPDHSIGLKCYGESLKSKDRSLTNKEERLSFSNSEGKDGK